MTLKHSLRPVLRVLSASADKIELVLQVVNAVLFIITSNPSTPWLSKEKEKNKLSESLRETTRIKTNCKKAFTFETLEPGFTLGADLVPFPPLILVASPANWESALVASNEQLPVGSEPDVIPTNMAELTTQLLQRPRLQHQKNLKKNLNLSTSVAERGENPSKFTDFFFNKTQNSTTYSRFSIPTDDNQLVPVMGTGNKAGAGLHCNRSADTPEKSRLSPPDPPNAPTIPAPDLRSTHPIWDGESGEPGAEKKLGNAPSLSPPPPPPPPLSPPPTAPSPLYSYSLLLTFTQ